MSPGKRGQKGTGKPNSGVVYLERPAWHLPSPESPEAAVGKGWPGRENTPERVRDRPKVMASYTPFHLAGQVLCQGSAQ